ncbi:TonB-dependent receptor, partial [Steroidobacter sp.]|uniref:TonB-dependent receptor n=1 Tax=Steroidobacter sp. TaxID=1978227 RepID=UPI001A61FF35
TSAEELQKLTPGLEVSNSGGVGTKVWTIRGVGFSDYSTAASSTVGIYVDEVAIPYPVMSTGTFFDVDHIEVIKGPQGDLFGRNTTAGQVSILSRTPTPTFEAGASLGFARYETVDFEGYLSGPITDSLRARLAVATTQSGEGWQRSATRPNDKLGEIDRVAVRGMLDWTLNDRTDLLLKLQVNNDKSDNIAPTAFDGRLVGLPDRTLHGAPFNAAGELESAVVFSTGNNELADWTNGPNNALRPRRDNQLRSASARLKVDLGGVELISVTGYDEFERTEANDWDGTALLDSSNINITDVDSFSQELRLAGDGDRLNWTVGAYYSTDEMNEDYNYFMGEGRFGINQLSTEYVQKTDAIAAFAHVEYKLTARTEAVLGVRYTSEDREWTGCSYDATPPDLAVAGLPLNVFLNNIINGPGVITPNGLLNDGFNFPNGLPAVNPLAPGACGTFNDIPGTPGAGQFGVFSRKISVDEPMWKVGLNFRPVDDVLLFGTISQGFKSGGFNGANSNTHSQLLPYEIEKLLAYEVGAKASFADRTVQLNGSVFFYDYRDKQEREAAVTPVGNISGISNIPKSEILGAEVELAWRPTQDWTVNLGVSVLDTKVVEWRPVDPLASQYPTVVRFDASGAELPNAPKFSGNLLLSYRIPVGRFELTPAFDLVHRSSTSGDITPENFRDEYTLSNLRLSLAGEGNWRTQLWVRNLFDEQYYVSGQTGGNFTYTRINGMPRTWGVTFEYSL